MAVKFLPKWTKADIQRIMEEKHAAIDRAIIEALAKAGEDFVKDARTKTPSTGNYTDITGNLRSSIAYVILKDGKQLIGDFKRSGGSRKYGGAKGAEGVSAAEKVMAEVKIKYKSGYALVVTAGMDYASSVEARGKDVLTNSASRAETRLKEAVVRLTKKIEKMAR